MFFSPGFKLQKSYLGVQQSKVNTKNLCSAFVRGSFGAIISNAAHKSTVRFFSQENILRTKKLRISATYWRVLPLSATVTLQVSASIVRAIANTKYSKEKKELPEENFDWNYILLEQETQDDQDDLRNVFYISSRAKLSFWLLLGFCGLLRTLLLKFSLSGSWPSKSTKINFS